MFPLGFIIFPYLIKIILKVVNQKSFLTLFYYGFSYGFGFLIIYLSWILNPFLVDQETKQFAFISILLPIFLSIFFGLFFLFYKNINKSICLIILTPFIFIFIELFISNFLYGFPWITYSLILSNNFLGLYIIKFYGTIVSSYLTISLFLVTILFFNNRSIFFFKLIFGIYLPFLITPIFLEF